MNIPVARLHELLPIESINALEVFTGQKLDELLTKIRREVTTLVPDVNTAAGRKEVASTAYKISRSKTAIDNAGKELVAGWKSQSAVVDASRKKVRDYLDALREEVRAPLNAWEAKEADKEAMLVAEATARREAEEAAKAADLAKREAAVLEAEERIAAHAKAEADRIAAEVAAKAQAAREDAIRKEAAEKANRDAAEALERVEREAAVTKSMAEIATKQAAHEARLASEKAERDKAEAVQQAEARAARQAAQLEAERKDALASEAAATELRESNRRHCSAVNNKAVSALVEAGLAAGDAQVAIAAIAKGDVPSVFIKY